MKVDTKKIGMLFSNAVSNPFKLYNEITKIGIDTLKSARPEIIDRLQKQKKLNPVNTILIGSILKFTGTTPVKLLDFFARYLKNQITPSHYAFCLRTLFNNSPPLPSDILFDLTEYTYLDRNIIMKKSIELTGAFDKKASPDLILFLLILSFRSDLSNENVKLILLLLRNMASKSLLQKIDPHHFEPLTGFTTVKGDEPLGLAKKSHKRKAGDIEHASFYLDKHFAQKKDGEEDEEKSPDLYRTPHSSEKKRNYSRSNGVNSGKPVVKKPVEQPKTRQEIQKKPVLSEEINDHDHHRLKVPVVLISAGRKNWIRVAAVLGTVAVAALFFFGLPGKKTESTGKENLRNSSVQTPAGVTRGEKTNDTYIEGGMEDNKAAVEEKRNAENPVGSDMAGHNQAPPLRYTIKAGDTLSGISKKYYNTADRYQTIAEMNNISDPDLIFTGNTLIIPEPGK